MSDTHAHIEIDPALKKRLSDLADQLGRPLREITEGFLRDQASEVELALAMSAEDDQRWQTYLETGNAMSFNDIRGVLKQNMILADQAAK